MTVGADSLSYVPCGAHVVATTDTFRCMDGADTHTLGYFVCASSLPPSCTT